MTESGHWYTREGRAAHTQPNKSSGGTRNTTIRDARKLKLLPSVSGVLRMMANGGLQNWKDRQIAGACYNRPPIAGETVQEWTSFILNANSEEQAKTTDFGTKVHAAIEAALAGNLAPAEEMATSPSIGTPMPLKAFVSPVLGILDDIGVVGRVSEGVCVSRLGYGGTVDLRGARNAAPIIVDFKTKKTKPGEPIITPLTYKMQLAAYFSAAFPQMPLHDCGIIFTSSSEPGRVEWHPVGAEELQAAWGGFLACLTLWKLDNEYDPAF